MGGYVVFLKGDNVINIKHGLERGQWANDLARPTPPQPDVDFMTHPPHHTMNHPFPPHHDMDFMIHSSPWPIPPWCGFNEPPYPTITWLSWPTPLLEIFGHKIPEIHRLDHRVSLSIENKNCLKCPDFSSIIL